LILRQLLRRVGQVTPERRSQIQSLSLTQLEALGEALLDFTKSDDLDEFLFLLGNVFAQMAITTVTPLLIQIVSHQSATSRE
jgi:hypothetical protein